MFFECDQVETVDGFAKKPVGWGVCVVNAEKKKNRK